MKITPSKDGVPRGTVTIRRRCSADDLVNAIGWVVVRDWTFYDAPNVAMRVETALALFKSKKSILNCFHRAFSSDGDTFWTWTDGLDDITVKEIKEQVLVLVFKKFPDLRVT